jgi:hypothetical protein
MTVQELIDELELLCLPNAEVKIDFANGDGDYICTLNEIEKDRDGFVILWGQIEV